MDFEWDELKRQENLAKHGVDFVDAALIFEGRVLSRTDDRKDYGEVRYATLGKADGHLYVVIHTVRDGRTRLISAWKGGRREHEYYEKSFPGPNQGDERAG